MTPRDLCDLAAKINAAVPGLVKDFRPIARSDDPASTKETRVVDHFTSRTHIMDDAAAMMLGRVSVKRDQLNDATSSNDEEAHTVLLMAEAELYAYVATTLPGAKQ